MYKKLFATGRKPKYDTPGKLQKAIQAYFDECFEYVEEVRRIPKKKKGRGKNPGHVLDKKGRVEKVDEVIVKLKTKKVPSISGLASAVGLTRKGLIRYEEASTKFMNKLLTEEDCETLGISKDQYEGISLASEFSYTIKKAKNEIEMFNEEKLIRGNNVAGVIFNLTNNYGRKNRQYIDAKTDNTNKNENTHSGEVKFVMEYAPPTDGKGTPQPDDVLSDNDG